jgi:MFS family permease
MPRRDSERRGSMFSRKSEGFMSIAELPTHYWHNFGKVMFLAVGCFILFTGSNTTLSLLSAVLEDDGFKNLGFYSLGFFYFCMGISSFFAMRLIEKLGDKWAIVISCVTYAIYTGA